MFHNLKNPQGLWDAVQTFQGKHLRSKMLLPSMTNNNPLLMLQEHPEISSTSSYSRLGCVLRAPLVQTPRLAHRNREGGGGGVIKDVTVWCSVCLGVRFF